MAAASAKPSSRSSGTLRVFDVRPQLVRRLVLASTVAAVVVVAAASALV